MAGHPWENLTVTEAGCHVWNGARHAQGYGITKVDGRLKKAHRVAWERAKGPIPEGMILHHRCQNEPCVNVEHLELMTKGAHQSLHRALESGPAGKVVQCKRGHSYERGKGRCGECKALTLQAWKDRNPGRWAEIRRAAEAKRTRATIRPHGGKRVYWE